MKAFLSILVSLILTNGAFGQTTDSAYTLSSTGGDGSLLQRFYDARGNRRWISKDHVTVVTTKLRLTTAEEEISALESSECKALLKRDTAALKNIWLRDFTLEEPQNEVHLGKNPIPYYVGIHRTIETITVMDNIVYTSGQENIGQLTSDGSVEAPIIRRFTHVWTKELFAWKLSSKTYE